jgi:hypothetical protein
VTTAARMVSACAAPIAVESIICVIAAPIVLINSETGADLAVMLTGAGTYGDTIRTIGSS